MKKRNLGVAAAVGSYLLWGLLPVYWKQLSAVSAYEILSHRIIWSFFFMLMILSFMGRMVSFWEECKRLWADKSRGTLLALASFLITANWCIFIWAVTNRHVVDTSVGYYMNPLVSVLLGVVCFHERLSKMKWFSIAVAAAGIGKDPADCCRSCIDICPLRRGEKEIESGCFLQHYAGNIFCSSFCPCLCIFSWE